MKISSITITKENIMLEEVIDKRIGRERVMWGIKEGDMGF